MIFFLQNLQVYLLKVLKILVSNQCLLTKVLLTVYLNQYSLIIFNKVYLNYIICSKYTSEIVEDFITKIHKNKYNFIYQIEVTFIKGLKQKYINENNNIKDNL